MARYGALNLLQYQRLLEKQNKSFAKDVEYLKNVGGGEAKVLENRLRIELAQHIKDSLIWNAPTMSRNMVRNIKLYTKDQNTNSIVVKGKYYNPNVWFKTKRKQFTGNYKKDYATWTNICGCFGWKDRTHIQGWASRAVFNAVRMVAIKHRADVVSGGLSWWGIKYKL